MTGVSKKSEIKTKIVEEPMTAAKSYVFVLFLFCFFWGGGLSFGGWGNKYFIGGNLLGVFLYVAGGGDEQIFRWWGGNPPGRANPLYSI